MARYYIPVYSLQRMNIFFARTQGSEQSPDYANASPQTAGRGLPIRFCQIPLRLLLTLDRFFGHGLCHLVGSDNLAIRPGIAPNRRRVRCPSAMEN